MLKVIVLSGFLGAGKTTLVKHILSKAEGQRVAIVLNDISEVDIDVDLVKTKQLNVAKRGDIVEMSNGCICCTLKEDMIKQVKKIAKTKKYDYLVIEATGVSTPLPVAQAFAYTPAIQPYAELYAMITVIDALHFEENLISNQLVTEEEKMETRNKGRKKKKKQEAEEDQDKPILAELMIDQLQVADLVLINKIDLVDNAQKEAVIGYVKGISPQSEIILTEKSKVDLSILFKKRFNLEEAEICQRWIGERQREGEDIPETVKYNISSFIYHARRPFDPVKFHDLLTNSTWWPFWGKVTRAKGFFWLANYPRYQFQMHKAGGKLVYAIEQPWFSEMPRREWAETAEERRQVKKLVDRYWKKPHGDKRNEIVFIGKDLEKESVITVLDSCLIPEEEMAGYENAYKQIKDPFNGQWADAIAFFKESLLENDDQWEEVEDGSDQEEGDEEEEEQMEEEVEEKKENDREAMMIEQPIATRLRRKE